LVSMDRGAMPPNCVGFQSPLVLKVIADPCADCR
jgi:hypothetical protein